MNNEKVENLKFLGLVLCVVIVVIFFTNSTKILKKPTDTFVVEKGMISYEESASGYIIRDEYLLQGENAKNGMVQIKYENEKVSKGDSVFRYFSNNEENLVKQIAKLDEEINDAIAQDESSAPTSDMLSVEKQIEDTLDSMYDENELRKLEEEIKKIEV